MRQVASGSRQNRAPRSGDSAIQRGARTELAIAPALIRTEEERPIRTADDSWSTFAKARQMQWTTERAAHLVLNPKRRLLPRLERRIRIAEAGALVGVAASVQRIAVVEPEQRAVIVVASRFGDGVEYRTGITSIFRQELVRDQTNFLNQVRIVQRLSSSGNAWLVIVLTVDHKVIGTDAATVGRVADAGGETGLAGAELADSRSRKCDGENIACWTQRQFRQASRVKLSGDFSVAGVDNCRVFGNVYHFLNATGFQGDINHSILVQYQCDA